MPTGIMPEAFSMVPCVNDEDCVWDVEKWHDAVKLAHSTTLHAEHYDVQDVIKEVGLQPGFSRIGDPRFLLR